jgi:hypothetical protein
MPGAIVVQNPCDTATLTLPGDSFDIICKVCHDRFRLVGRFPSAVIEKVAPFHNCQDLPSLNERFPLLLRRFVSFEGADLNAPGLEEQSDGFGLEGEVGLASDMLIVGSYNESSLRGFSVFDLI